MMMALSQTRLRRRDGLITLLPVVIPPSLQLSSIAEIRTIVLSETVLQPSGQGHF